MSTTTITSKNVDLSVCDREQIQFAGAILPHGFLLSLREPEFTILQASQNAGPIFGVETNTILGQSLVRVMDPNQAESIREKCLRNSLAGAPTRIAVVKIKGAEWNVLAHRYDQVLFLEFEFRAMSGEQAVLDLHSELRDAMAKIQNAKTSQQFLDFAVEQIRTFTGFDRVMAYKFMGDGSGWVRSESVIDGQTPYLGLHFPPSDVPVPAKRLFALTWLRHQPNIHYIPVPIIPENNPLTGAPLDLSYAVLRSVSVMYTEYLKNMGTDSSMVMTLLKNGKLWGLIACHHHSGPKHVPYEIRAACEFLANMVSLLLAEKEDLEFADYKLHLKNTQVALVNVVSTSGEFAHTLAHGSPNLMDFVHAEGAAVVTEGNVSLIGATPSEDQVISVVDWISAHTTEEIFATESLTSVFPGAMEFCEVASGVLAIRFAVTKKDYLLWFRPEVMQTVHWAGDPHKPVDVSDDGQRLMPRTSFALWKQSVRFKSEPWLELEIQAAHELRLQILKLILRQTENLGELYKSLERSPMELDAFAYVASHDLKEPLRGIHNYSRFLLEDCAEQLRPEDMDKLRAMARLTQRMEDLLDSLLHYSRVSRNELRPKACDLNRTIAEVLELLSARVSESAAEIRITGRLPTVEIDESSISEVFSNLISNALKYNDKTEKWVEIGHEERAGGEIVLYVRDNGIGIAPENIDTVFLIFRRLHGQKEFGGGSGAGLTIARKIVERFGGRMWIESSPGIGSTFYFTVGTPSTSRSPVNVSK
jgi:two-component system, chemotaxis family, sensor kinase Cph1